MTKPAPLQMQPIEPDLDIEAIYAERIAGVSVKRIAKQFGVVESVINAILLERTQQVLSDDNVRIMVGLESDRLDQTLEALWPAVQKGDPTACGLAIKISQRRAVLFGIDAPSSHSVEIYRRHEKSFQAGDAFGFFLGDCELFCHLVEATAATAACIYAAQHFAIVSLDRGREVTRVCHFPSI